MSARLEASLLAVEAALRDEDAEAASRRMDHVLALCAEIGDEPLPPDVYARMVGLSASCLEAAAALRGAVGVELQQAGQSRKAISRYQVR